MKRNRRTYNIFQTSSAIFMMLTLLWLIVSLPLVSSSQLEVPSQSKTTNASSPLGATEEEADNPIPNTEEKAPNNISSFSEEYLHENYLTHYFFPKSSADYRNENASIYIAFHGELIVPPPDAA